MAGYLITFFKNRVRPVKLLTISEVKEIESEPDNYEKETINLTYGYCRTCEWGDAPLKSETGQCLLCLGWVREKDVQNIKMNLFNFYMVPADKEILYRLMNLSM